MTEQAKSKRRTLGCAIWAGLFVVILVGSLGAFQFIVKPMMIAEFFASNQQPPVVVSTVTAERKAWQPAISAIGTIIAVRGVDITAEAPGIVREIHFESGEDVAQGASLIRLNDEVEKADLEQNLAQLKEANLALERSKSLATRGNVSQATLDAAQASRDSAAAAVERTRALIAQKNVQAPFAGRLGVRRVNLGQYVAPGDTIVTLQSLDPLYVNFTLPEQALAVLAEGQKLDIKVDAYPERVFSGVVTSLESKVEASTRNVLIQATIANPENLLVPGMFADIELYYAGEVERITIPETAISFSLYGDFVYVAKPTGDDGLYEVERRTVEIDERRGAEVSIASGIEAGEEVVAAGQIKLRPGVIVKADNSQLPTPQSPRSKF